MDLLNLLCIVNLMLSEYRPYTFMSICWFGYNIECVCFSFTRCIETLLLLSWANLYWIRDIFRRWIDIQYEIICFFFRVGMFKIEPVFYTVQQSSVLSDFCILCGVRNSWSCTYTRPYISDSDFDGFAPMCSPSCIIGLKPNLILLNPFSFLYFSFILLFFNTFYPNAISLRTSRCYWKTLEGTTQ